MLWNLIHSVSLEKPHCGQACNGCGACCIAKVCDLGVTLGDDQNCIALQRQSDGSFNCGMVTDPYRYMADNDLLTWKGIDDLEGNSAGERALKAMHADMLGAGKGCDSDDQAMSDYLEEARANYQMCLAFPD